MNTRQTNNELERAKATAKEADKKRREEVKRRKEVEAKRDAEVEQAKEAVRDRYTRELAELQAQYGIDQAPTIFDVPDGVWREAADSATRQAEKEILDVVSDLLKSVQKIRRYSPERSARAILNWPTPRRSKEAIEEIAEWSTQVKDALHALTTPGVLRVLDEEMR